MKCTLAILVLAVAACGGPKNRPPPSAPVSTTQTTSSALTITPITQGEPVPVDESPAPIVAAKEADQSLATHIRSRLGRDQALQSVPWQRVSMEVEDQHVTLRGQLPTVADSSQVERAVRETKGVRAVTNEIRTNDAHQLR